MVGKSTSAQAVHVHQRGADAVQFVATTTAMAAATGAALVGSGYNVPGTAVTTTGKEVIIEAAGFRSSQRTTVTLYVGTSSASLTTIWRGVVVSAVSGGGGMYTMVPIPVGGIRPRVDGGEVRITTSADGVDYFIAGHVIKYNPTATIDE